MKLWLSWFFFFASSAALCAFSQEQPRYAGIEACSSCHVAQQKTVAGTPHENRKGCEGCHGPGEAHIRSTHDRGRIFNFRRASAAEVRERCGQCHSNPTMTRHAVGDVSCTACHSSHHYVTKKNLLRPADDTLQHPAERRSPMRVPAARAAKDASAAKASAPTSHNLL